MMFVRAIRTAIAMPHLLMAAPFVALLLASTALTGAAQSRDAGTPSSAFLSDLAGEWQGTLTYRDYQSDRRVSIPLAMSNTVEKVGGVLHSDIQFTDPGRIIRNLDMSTLSEDGSEWIALSVADGEFDEERLIIASFDKTPSGWQVVLTGSGQDDGRPADLRITRTLSGDSFTSTKEVRLQGAPDAEWAFRNGFEVTRVVPSVEQLLGNWKVDLRPTPGADDYFQSFVVRKDAEGGTLSGEFYGTPVQNFEVNLDWGYVSFAFTTEDGSGTYHTSGKVVAGRLEGRTHSLGRGFLAEWSAVRE